MKKKVRVCCKSSCPLRLEGEKRILSQLELLISKTDLLSKEVNRQYEHIQHCIYHLQNRKEN